MFILLLMVFRPQPDESERTLRKRKPDEDENRLLTPEEREVTFYKTSDLLG